MMPSLMVALLVRSIDHALPISLAVAAVGLYLYGALYLLPKLKGEQNTTYLMWCVARVLVYLLLMGSVGDPVLISQVAVTVGLMSTTVFNVYQMVNARSKGQAIASCLMTNFHLWMIASMWEYRVQLVLSLLGLLLGAGFIVVGFIRNIKSARKCGLVCCILYSIKMGLFDIGYGGLGTAGGLVLAGVVCFGISIAYNLMSEKYDNHSGRE